MADKNFEIVQPSGILDGVSAKDLRTQILDLLESKKPTSILVDLQDLTFSK